MDNTDSIVARMRACIERNIACFEAMLQACVSIEQMALEENVLEGLYASREKDNKILAGLQHELDLLLREWRQDDTIAVEERAMITELASHAFELDQQLQQAREKSISDLKRYMLSIQNGLVGLHKGHNMLDKFRSPEKKQAGYIDRKA